MGEPGFPVAAAERGRRVLVRAGASFEFGDHEFTKFSLVPSVALVNKIPSALEDSWYCGQVIRKKFTRSVKVHGSLLSTTSLFF